MTETYVTKTSKSNYYSFVNETNEPISVHSGEEPLVELNPGDSFTVTFVGSATLDSRFTDPGLQSLADRACRAARHMLGPDWEAQGLTSYEEAGL